MSLEKKRKLRNIALLALLCLIGGTFAFTAFNQQAINDRLRENPAPVGARVHDYFSRQTENKDIFVENYGQEPIMARIRLSEFMEYQERGEAGWTQVVEGNRHDSRTWTIYKPETGNINNRRDDSAAFTPFSTLVFGWERDNQDEPWYLPTFNHDSTDLTTAAAGDAQDYIERGATHPGDGTDNYWGENISYPNGSKGITWPGSTESTRTTSQNLRQERNPVTLQQWYELPEDRQIGNFWVMDEDGWAYWANTINSGQATSYLLDEAQMTSVTHEIQGSYYYAIHVDSQLINVSDERFEAEETTGAIAELLEGIRNSDGNPFSQASSPIRDFTFSRMRDTAGANTRFSLDTPVGRQQFRYLENMGDGNHLIIRNDIIANINWYGQENELIRWFNNDLPEDFKKIVAPVARTFTTGMVTTGAYGTGVSLQGGGWSVGGLDHLPEIAGDRTLVDSSGVPRAFSLSLADVQHLSAGSPNIGFMNMADRLGGNPNTGINDGWWHLRTPWNNTASWLIHRPNGNLNSNTNTGIGLNGGIRPALIIHQ